MPRNWFRISKILSFREKIIVIFFIAVILVSLVFWVRYIYLDITVPVPKVGGEYSEGIIGQPVYINPLLSQTSEADSDLVNLIYNGLLKYGNDGKIENDISEGYEVSEDGKKYTFHLRKDVFWHDGEHLDAEDVKFTFDILRDPAYKSPLRRTWLGVEQVNQVDEYTIEFVLSNPYFGFLNNLTTGILPKHIWQDISPERFSLADLNLSPIGSGPYLFSGIQKDSLGQIISVELISFEKYFEGEPYISKITINFYLDEETMISEYNNKKIDGIGNISLGRISEITREKSTSMHELIISHYFAVFLNRNKSIVLANDEVRKALLHGVNRDVLISEVLKGKGSPVYSPFLLQMEAYSSEGERYGFDVEKAKQIFEDDGWKMNEEKGFREKEETELRFKLFTIDSSEISETANILASQWKEIGVQVDIEMLSASDIRQNHIRTREYDALLFGQAINFNPDPYEYWHSSRKDDPGLNLSLFKDNDADKLLDEARQESDSSKRKEKYLEFQKIMAEINPAVFLYSPYYIYPVGSEIKGINVEKINSPSSRLTNVNKWYIKTKRIRK